MIVPIFDFNEIAAEPKNVTIPLLRRFALLGRIAIRLRKSSDANLLEEYMHSLGGYCEVQVYFEEFDATQSIGLLNAGANQILYLTDLEFGEVPEDRMKRFAEVEQPEPAGQLSVDSVVASWKATQDRYFEFEVTDQELQKFNSLVSDVVCKLAVSDRPDGLWTTTIVDQIGLLLGLAYSNKKSLRYAIQNREGAFYSRSRQELWVKGKTSGATQRLVGLRFDCDFDAIKFVVEQERPGFCHNETHTCFGFERNIAEVFQRLQERVSGSDAKSFTKKLFNDPEMLRKKLVEEANELAETDTHNDAVWETADVLYFAMIALMRHDGTLDSVFRELARRMQRVVRRPNKLEANHE